MIRPLLRFTWLILFLLLIKVNLYAAAPIVSTVTVPPGNYKIGSAITFTIVTDGAGYTVDAGTTINGVDVTSTFASAGGNNYTLTYTVASGNTDRASVGAIPINILIRNGAGAGNLNTYTSSAVSAGVTIDANAPTISNVAIPNVAMKVGSVVTATITVADDGGQTYTLSSGTIGGFTLGSFTRITNTSYEAQFTVTNGGTDVAAGSNIPVNVVIADPATNPSAAYTTAIAQGGDPIDANIPTISNVTIPNSAMKVGSVVTATITVGNDGGQTYLISSGTIGGFALGSLTRTNSTTYTAQFTVSNGGADVAAGSDIPVSLVIADPATNPSATYSTAISQNADPIDANIPTVSNVTVPDAAMKVGDVVTATITVGDDGGQTYTLNSSTIGGFTLGSFSRTNSTTYTAQFTISNGGTDVAAGSNIPVSVIVADAATNPSVAFTTAISQAGDPIDSNNPAVQIVGPLVTTGGNVVANFWNSTNTGINITVPITNSDASLDNGSIQLQANVNGGGFSNVGVASTITNGQRVAGLKVFSLTDAEFEAISSTETTTIRFRATVTDNVGNTSTFTQSALITIDQTAPAALVAAPDLTTGTDTEGLAGTGTGTTSDNITKSTNPTFTGSGVNGTTVKIYSGATEIGSGSVSGSAYTISVGAISESVHVITGRVMDPAGNLSAATTPYNVTIDRTPPQVVLKVWNADGPAGNREEIIMTFTELLDMSDALLIANSDGDDTKHGFSSSAGGIRDADSKFFSSYTVTPTTYTNAIVLRSLSNGDWASSAVQMRYKDFATAPTNANGNNPNYVYDLAGNELVTVTVTASDTDAPKLASGFVLNPNGNSFETIVFRVNETLSQGASVTGFSVNGVPVTGTYDLASTITLTSLANGAWNNSATVSYTPGNVKDGSNNFLAAIPSTPLRLQNINIASNNANTQLAKVGDVVTVNFVTSTAPSVTPKVILDNDNATPALVTGAHPNYQATYTITGANNNGPLAMLVYMLTATDSTATTSTTLPLPVSSSITVDKNIPAQPTLPDLATSDDLGISNSDNYTTTNTNLDFSGLAGSVEANSTVRLYSAVSTLLGTTTATGAGAWTITVPGVLSDGVYSITVTSTDAAGNISPASPPLVVTIDNISPSVTSISLPSPNPNNTSSVDFTVVFDGGVVNVDAGDFSPYGSSSIGTTVSNVVANSSSNYTVTVSGIFLLGQLGLNLIDDGSIVDLASNQLGGPFIFDGDFTSPTQYSIVLPEPPNYVTSFQLVSTSFTSMTLSWVDAVGFPSPTGYLITVARSGATAIVPPDYTTPIAQQTNLITNTTGYLYVAPGNQFASFNNLLSGENYTFKIYPYTNSGANIDFKTDGVVPTVGPAATPVDNFVWINNSSPMEPASFPSTTTSSGVAVVNFRFQVYDDGWGSLDNASTKITAVRIRRNLVTDQIGDWFDALQSVELTDGVTTKTGTIDPSGDFITFSGLYDGVTEFFGEVADNGNKYYMLKVILKTSLGGTLPQNIDNKGFVFEIRNADLTLASNSSTLNAGNDTHPNAPSSGAGNNKVSVTATKFDFTTNLPPTIGVKHPFLVAPVVVARDINNNTDVNHTNYTITLSDATSDFSTSNTFALGVLTLNNFVFNTPGIRTITISSAGLTSATSDSDNITGGNQTTEAVISDNTTVVVAGAAPGSIPSVTTIAPGFLPPAGQQNAVVNFSFTVQDDNAVPVNEDDILPTRIKSITIKQNANNGTAIGGATFDNWQNSIAGASLRVGFATVSSTVTINTNSIVFDNLPSTAGGLGFITDGTSRTYTVSVWLQNPVNSALRDILDGEDFVFEITNATDFGLDSTPTNLSSTLAAVTGFNSGNSNNTVTVTATQLDFITQPAATQSYDAPITPTPTAKARDANQNLDRDFGGVVTVATPTPLTYPLANSAVGVTAGNISFNSNLQVTSAGNGANNASTNLVISSTGLTNGSSTSFILGYSALSNIIKDTNFKSTSTYASGDGYPENILYNTYQASTFTANTDGIALERFILQDGGGSNDADGTATKLQSITLNISNYQYLRTVAIYDGSTKVAERVVAGNITNISGITGDLVIPSLITPFQAADNGTNDFTVFATFNQTAILDNEVIQIRVNGATPAAVSSSFVIGGTVTTFAPLNASENENKIEVVATQIDFTTLPAAASISVPLTIQVSARDANANLDADYNGSITATSNTNTGSFTTANDPTGAFTGGIKNYPVNFQFTTGNGNIQLTINSGAGSAAGNVNAAAISGTSPVISVISSFDSWLYFDPTFAYTPRIDFANKQEDPIVSTSQPLARLILSDGGSAFSIATLDNPQPGVKNQTTHKDVDGAFTKIDDFTISLTNFQDIRKIALYASDGVTKIGSDQTPAASVTFTGLSSYFAPDDGTYEFYIRASFNATVSDLNQIGMQITAITHDSGSKFAELKPSLPPAAIAGVDGAGAFGDSSPLTNGTVLVNVLDVITTKFDFIQSPPRYAGIDEPVPLSGTPVIKVEARDKFNNLDTEFNSLTNPTLYGVSVTAATATVNSGGGTFVNGVLLLPTLRYTNPGNGKLTVTSTNNPAVTSNVVGALQCTPVDVIHVTAVKNESNGVSLVESLKGGTTNNRIFGFTFQAPHVDAPNSEPLLEGFSITFKNDDGDPYPYSTSGTTIFKNFKIFKSINGAAPTPTTSELTIAEVASEQLLSNNPSTTSKDMVKVTFINKPTLYDGKLYTFYLSVDVDVSVSVGTLAITPYLEDQGNGFPFTNNHILISNGSTKADVIGIPRRFASTKPPLLTKTTPNNGTLNVRKDLEYVEVHFDVPVVTFDGVAYLFKRDNPTDTVAVLNAVNGLFVDSNTLPAADAIKTQVVDSIRFLLPLGLPDLEADEVYFITLPKGRFSTIDRNDRAGISDEGLNLYGGISFNGEFYFKVGSDQPPILLSSNNDKYFYTPTTATFNTQFDQAGKAYYMVVKSSGATLPTVTNDQILGNVAIAQEADVIKRDFYPISQVSPNYQYTTINSNLIPDTDYWVYLFAENDRVPTPARHDKPYGGFIDDGASNNDYVVGGSGPTLILNKPSSPPVTRYNNPSFTICTNSSIKLQEPIIISEIASNDFQGTGVQTFNLLLPSGFQFDIERNPVFNGNGSDFDPLPTGTERFKYINTTFLEISFVNTRNISTDNIIITDIYVIASKPDLSGKIKRFGGTGLLTEVPDQTDLATISSIPASSITFTNTYSDANDFDLTPLFIANTVTYIPDNYVDANGTSTIRLIPVIAPGVRDFGSSSFSGSGLTNDILTLSAVSLNSAFNITITHTDQNGCVSNSSEQYAVYDHTAAIPELLPDPDDDKDIRIAISNINFPNNPPSLKDPSQKVSYEGLAGFKLLDLYANVPSRATAISDTTNLAENPLTDQIIFGNNWENLIKYIPVPIASVLSDNLSSPGNDVFYKTYNWDYTSILHNDSLDNYDIANPYVTFFERTTLAGQKYYTGGSLGLVEFTGKYQSTADFSVFVPYRQEVELFVPAIPVIEVSGESSFQGSTPVFCETTSGNILISGYPAASSTSKGSFALYDSANYNPNNPNNPAAIIYKVGLNPKKEPSGFIDNANGTANLNVGQIFNSYRTIRIEYTYQDNNSPAIGKGVTYIRVTPNPVAKFSTSNLCEDIPINFTDESLFVSANGVRIAKWDWNFNDINAITTNPNRETIQNPIHRYSEPLDYPNVSLIVTTNFGCASPVNQKTLSIGGTPAVIFDFRGVSTADSITFTNQSTIANDVTKKLDWTFGDGNTKPVISGFNSPVNNKYTNAGAYTANLKVTSVKGCYDSLSKSVIILPRVISTPASPYLATFETDNGGWQHAPTDTADNMSDSWAHGVVNKTLTKSTIDGTRAWATSLTGTFSANERSALYSPSFDISGLTRPMVSFDKFVQFNNNEGVIIQYSVDNKNVADETKEWYVLGEKIEEGVEWFNGQSIASKPGDQPINDFGWNDSDIKEWREAKHTISNVSPKPPVAGTTRVVFRFALAARESDLPITVDNEGFAIDNFRVGERTRIILHESFANTGNSSADELSENTIINNFKTVGTDVVRINYHTGFPGADPFNLDNPADNSSRALFYNVRSTPDSYLDGQYGGIQLIKQKFSAWGDESFDKQTLSLANAKIDINQTIDADGIKINVVVTAIETTIPKDSVALFIAVLEESIPFSSLSSSQKTKVASGETEFDYVLKKMLPSAAGTILSADITNGTTKNFGINDETFTWKPDPSKFYSPNTGDLAVVAFLQNVVTKKIYQSSIVMDLNDPIVNVVTGIEAILPEQVNVYPNPASKEFKVELPAFVQNEVPINLIDLTGRKHEGGAIRAGSNEATVNVENLSEGIYILEIGSGNTGIIRKKIMVVMKN